MRAGEPESRSVSGVAGRRPGGTGELWMGGLPLPEETAHGKGGRRRDSGQDQGGGFGSVLKEEFCLLFWGWPMGPAG